MNAETIPANSASMTMAHLTLGTRSNSRSAIRLGIFDWMVSATVPMVPAIISRTLKSTYPRNSSTGSIPLATKTRADPMAMMGR